MWHVRIVTTVMCLRTRILRHLQGEWCIPLGIERFFAYFCGPFRLFVHFVFVVCQVEFAVGIDCRGDHEGKPVQPRGMESGWNAHHVCLFQGGCARRELGVEGLPPDRPWHNYWWRMILTFQTLTVLPNQKFRFSAETQYHSKINHSLPFHRMFITSSRVICTNGLPVAPEDSTLWSKIYFQIWFGSQSTPDCNFICW